MTIKSRLIVAVSSAFLAAGLMALPALAATTAPAKPAATPAHKAAAPAHKAAAPVLPKALVGKPKAFVLKGKGERALKVEDRAGAWYAIDLTRNCKPLAKAKAIRIAKSRLKGHIGSVVIGKRYCPIKSFTLAAADKK